MAIISNFLRKQQHYCIILAEIAAYLIKPAEVGSFNQKFRLHACLSELWEEELLLTHLVLRHVHLCLSQHFSLQLYFWTSKNDAIAAAADDDDDWWWWWCE